MRGWAISMSCSSRIAAAESATRSRSRKYRLPREASSSVPTSRPLALAIGIVSQTNMPSQPSGISIGGGSAEVPGMSNGVPSWKMPEAARSPYLFCCATSRSGSTCANPQGYGLISRVRLSTSFST